MVDAARIEEEDRLFAARAAEQAAERRLRRRAVVAALVVHLLVLLAPRPRSDPGPPADPGDPRLFLLSEVRFAPPAPPEPVVPELEAEVEETPPEEEQEEEAAAPPGPPPPPPVEVLFPEGDLSRLTPPRPLAAVPPPAPPGAPAEGGEVHLYLQLDERGQVYGVRTASGDPALLTAAAEAAKAWVFSPATLDGQPLPVVVEVVVRFPRPRVEPPPPG